jgi:hypothetical protein
MHSILLRAIWFGVSLALFWGSMSGGDSAIVCGSAWLLWTVPFGVFWQFVAYDTVVRFMQPQTAQILGFAIVVVSFYLFWFVAFPAIGRRTRAGKA